MNDRGGDAHLADTTRGSPARDGNHRTAFLEFGSTSIKFYLVATAGEEAGQVQEEIKVPWDLGYDVFQHARVSPSTVSRCTSALRDLQSRFPEIAFDSVTAVGTAALREAQNVSVFQRVIWEELGLKIHIIEGGIEAFLLETGFRDEVESFPTGLFDLGGGSLELVEYLSPYATKKTSLPVGAIRLHCTLRRTKDLFGYVEEGRRLSTEILREHLEGRTPNYTELIGTGGTVRTIAKLTGKDEVDADDIKRLLDRELRGEIWSELPPYRRPVLLPGILVVESLLLTLNLQRIVYKTASVKQGLINLTNLVPGIGAASRVDS